MSSPTSQTRSVNKSGKAQVFSISPNFPKAEGFTMGNEAQNHMSKFSKNSIDGSDKLNNRYDGKISSARKIENEINLKSSIERNDKSTGDVPNFGSNMQPKAQKLLVVQGNEHDGEKINTINVGPEESKGNS